MSKTRCRYCLYCRKRTYKKPIGSIVVKNILSLFVRNVAYYFPNLNLYPTVSWSTTFLPVLCL